ncbi:hypothetical protein, partial [Burkholderia ubonensis]|uniref:hypothetical protein n=1 Tax=Burkholderia ubonensis TaxID=101571 RepID=UPI0012FC39ED
MEEYPGMAGTGFIARREDTLFYITARHCLTKDHRVDIGALAGRLHIPFSLQGETVKSSDYVQFEHAISLKHQSEDLPGELIDLLVLWTCPCMTGHTVTLGLENLLAGETRVA